MNKSDSERIAGILQANGLESAQTIDDADLVVFNTCVVRENAENRFYGHLADIKKNNGDTTVIVAGCLSQREKRNLIENHGVDIAVGPQSIDMIEDLLSKKGSAFREETKYFPTDLPEKKEKPYFAWLPIITGCNNYCSYCAVPYVRGREKSTPVEKIIDSAGKAVSEGTVELYLLGQNVNSYGNDLYAEPRFAYLLNELAKNKDIERIRFATSHPKDLNDDVISAVAQNKNVCGHIHLPVQSGSTKILNKMGRGYDKDHYLKLIATIREKIKSVSITTDIMVGFPGETDEDFKETLDVVEKCAFDSAFTFLYSPRPGAKSYSLPKIDKKVTAARFKTLAALVQEKSREANERQVGKTFSVLIEGKSKKNPSLYSGRTMCNRLVHFSSDKSVKEGEFVNIKINKSFSWYLTGEIS